MDYIKKAQRWLISLFVLFILGVPVMFASIIFEAGDIIFKGVIPVVSFIVGCYTLYLLLGVRKTVKERGLNLQKSIRDCSKEEFNVCTLFGALIGVCFGAFLFSLTFTLIAVGVGGEIAIGVVFVSLFGYYIAVFGYGIHQTLKKKGIKFKLGFNRSKLPVAVIDYIVAGLIIYVAVLLHQYVSWILLGTGALIAFATTVLLFVKIDRIY